MKIDIIVVREPDLATELRVFIDGVEHTQSDAAADVEITEVHIDPGAGWQRDDWNENREHSANVVHPDVAQTVRTLFDELGESPYVQDA